MSLSLVPPPKYKTGRGRLVGLKMELELVKLYRTQSGTLQVMLLNLVVTVPSTGGISSSFLAQEANHSRSQKTCCREKVKFSYRLRKVWEASGRSSKKVLGRHCEGMCPSGKYLGVNKLVGKT